MAPDKARTGMNSNSRQMCDIGASLLNNTCNGIGFPVIHIQRVFET